MEPIQDFASLISRLRSLKERKRVVVVCPNDPHTEYVITVVCTKALPISYWWRIRPIC